MLYVGFCDLGVYGVGEGGLRLRRKVAVQDSVFPLIRIRF